MNTTEEKTKTLNLEDVLIAYQFLKDVVAHTPLQKNDRLSEQYDCQVYVKERICSTSAPLSCVVLIIR